MTQTKRRYEFIDDIRQNIAMRLPMLDRDTAIEIIKRWEAGEQARDLIERGVFNACEAVKTDIEAWAARQDAEQKEGES